MRLDKYLWELGSRSEIKKLLKTGAVTVDGKAVKDGGFQVTENSVVCFNEKKIEYREFIYLIMNKPQGVVSATWDKKLPVVVDLIDEEYKKFEPFPVGRLDIDTEGLLIITNDGKLTHELTSPKKNIQKKYLARTTPPMDKEDIKAFEEGMDLGDFTSLPGKLEFTDDPEEVYITICEGKFHQVKRMCQKCGKTVTFLKRVSIGGLNLESFLDVGNVKEITKEELTDKIYNISTK